MPRLTLQHVRPFRIARAEVRQDQMPSACPPSDLTSLLRRGVTGPLCPLGLLLGEGGLVDQQVTPLCGLDRGLAGSCVAGIHDGAAWTRGPQHFVRRHLTAAGSADHLTPLQATEEGPSWDAELERLLRVELAGALVLPQHVPVGTARVVGKVGGDLVPGLTDRRRRLESSDLHWKAQLLQLETHRLCQKLLATGRRVDA